ncbi:type II secretion system minor pseudopilin GspK [Marinobacter sp. SS21]|uniref:type II secretion system minor pseudopilin GspK n=1 Tax=Marinobacter sp. SS21 TaxID=2979460 RepID=UPI00233111A4|nr:type II secretion system minor pseudopilin GspK [Marinobacter sp. SS21]MDC0663384.1 type II secretion system minor pseudopilin GspK [Marinobacter sp. SS21]
MTAFSPVRQQRGVALIMVLLAMALVIMLTAGMTQQQSVRIFRAGHYLAQQQGYSVALGAEEFAQQILFKDYEQDKDDGALVDSPDEPWSQYSAILPLDDQGVAEVQIDDLSGRINLNDLVTASGDVDAITRARLERLLQVLDINTVKVDALIDWLDANDETVSASGAEDGLYLVQQPSYRAANQKFTSVSELLLIMGMTDEDYRKLRPHVAALPVSGLGINVNMATAAVLQSLHERLTPSQAEAILAKVKEERFEEMADFLALPEFAGLGMKADRLSLNSRFFDVVSRITFDNRTVNLVSTLYRSSDGKFQIVARDSGQKHRIDKPPFAVSEG